MMMTTKLYVRFNVSVAISYLWIGYLLDMLSGNLCNMLRWLKHTLEWRIHWLLDIDTSKMENLQ